MDSKLYRDHRTASDVRLKKGTTRRRSRRHVPSAPRWELGAFSQLKASVNMYFRKTSNQQYARTHTCRTNTIAYHKNVHKGREVGENGQRQTLVPKGDRATDFDDMQSENEQTRRTNRKITIFPLAVKASSRQCCLVPASWGEEAETNGGRQARPNGAWSWGHPRKTHHTKDATHELGLDTFSRRSWEDPLAWRFGTRRRMPGGG